MKIDLWMPDAAKIASQQGFLNVIHRRDDISRYLDKIGEGDNIFFLIGPKGSGKTHLLLCKSYLYRQAEKGYKFNVGSRQLVEYAEHFRNTLSEKDLQKFRNSDLWKSIWTLCLLIIIFKSAEIDLPSTLQRKIESLLGNSSRISAMLTNVFKNRGRVYELVNLSGELSAYIGDIQSGVAIFVDNVDQAFEQVIIDSHERISAELTEAAVDTWVNAQMGLLDAVYTLCTQHDHLKIFVTIRLEAFRIDHPRGQNYKYHSIKLHYEKEEIHHILNNRIQVISGKKDLNEFLGFEKMPHSYYKNPDGTPFEEDVFDFVYRHTYGRPREITAIGQKLSELTSNLNYADWDDKKKQDKVRNVINEMATEFFEDYKKEVIPSFDEDAFESFLQNLPHNVFSKEEKFKFKPEILDFYYTLGLIGYVSTATGSMIQKFRNFSQYEFRKIRQLPPADYYFIHPTLNRKLMETINQDVLDRNHLIGPDLPFHPLLLPVLQQDQKIEYYKPLKVIGDRWEKPYQRQSEPLKNYYGVYFKRLDDILRAYPKNHKRSLTSLVL